MPSPPYRMRVEKLRERLDTLGLQAYMVTHLPDVRYLCGFTGSNAVLIVGGPGDSKAGAKGLLKNGRNRPVLFTDGRYTTQAKLEVKGARVAIAKKSALTEAAELLARTATGACGVDGDHVTVAQLTLLHGAISGKGPPEKKGRKSRPQVRLQPRSGMVSAIREVKDNVELSRMRAAALLGCRLFAELLPQIRRGMTERQLAAKLEYAARTSGAEAMSFETIVASGRRSALPHGTASSAPISRGFLLVDFGVMLDGYCSDMTRTVHLGAPSRAERQAYEAVLEAQMAAIETVRDGVSCGEVDEAARSVLRRHKLAKYFSHSTGHGVGLEIHEGPRIAAKQQEQLRAGMVITIEPGVYQSDRFGIRIEDMVLVTARGGEVLTPAPKKFTVL